MQLRELGNLSKVRLIDKISIEGSIAAAPTATRTQSNHGARLSRESSPDTLGRSMQNAHPPGDSIALSQTGKLIAKILAVELMQSSTASLTSSTPLIEGNSEPQLVAERFSKIVGGSGLFYESHLADWVAGKRDLAHVRAESDERTLAVATSTATKGMDGSVVRDSLELQKQSAQNKLDSQSVAESLDEVSTRIISQTLSNGTPVFEDRNTLQIVRHQLDALATGQIVWQGLVSEGVPGEIEISHEARDGKAEQVDVWRARIRIICPNLGDIDVAIALVSNHLSLQVAAASDVREHLVLAADVFKKAVQSRGIELGALAIADPNIRSTS
jgi:hypothetical protein